MSDQITKTLLNVVLGLNRPVIAIWPVATGVPATGATITPGAAAWGVLADIIAAAAILTQFFIIQLQYDSAAAVTEEFEIELRNTTLGRNIYQDRPDTIVATVNLGPTTPPFPIWASPSAQIQCRAGAAAATTLNVSLLTAVGL